MVYRPDGSGRDMYVLGPRNSKGPQIVDVAARDTALLNREANRALLNASLMRTDNKVPMKMPDYELKAIISRKISDRNAASAEASSLPPAKLALNATLDATHGSGDIRNASMRSSMNGTVVRPVPFSAPATPKGSTMRGAATMNINAMTAVGDVDIYSTVSPLRYNAGLPAGGNSPKSAVVTQRATHYGAANSYFTTCQRAPSSYVSPKTPSMHHSATGRVGGDAYRQALETSHVVNGGGFNATGSSLGGTNANSIPSTPTRGGVASRRAPSAGFVYNRYIYESTQERASRTGLAFQTYEAPPVRQVLPEVRARYSNL